MAVDDFKYSKAPHYVKYVPGEVWEEFTHPTTDSQYTGGFVCKFRFIKCL
jgi:hypothetical protein